MTRAGCLFLACLCGTSMVCGVDEVPGMPVPDDDGAIPQPMRLDEFEALVMNPPFTRSLGVSDSLILTGVAHFENDVVATLLDTATMESQVVSRTANFQGWQLVGFGGDPDRMQTWTARIQIPGGEVVSIRYQEPPKKRLVAKSGTSGSSGSSGGKSAALSSSQMSDAKKAAVNYKEGFDADGYPKAPPPEMVSKLSKLSVSQREDINKQMFGYRNQGLGLDERRKIYENLVDRSVQGRR